MFNSRCVIKLREILVRATLAQNLNFFTTFRSEALALMSVSWIGDCMTSTKNRTIEKTFPPKYVRFAFRFVRKKCSLLVLMSVPVVLRF